MGGRPLTNELQRKMLPAEVPGGGAEAQRKNRVFRGHSGSAGQRGRMGQNGNTVGQRKSGTAVRKKGEPRKVPGR